jgi:hypothetical protein
MFFVEKKICLHLYFLHSSFACLSLTFIICCSLFLSLSLLNDLLDSFVVQNLIKNIQQQQLEFEFGKKII